MTTTTGPTKDSGPWGYEPPVSIVAPRSDVSLFYASSENVLETNTSSWSHRGVTTKHVSSWVRVDLDQAIRQARLGFAVTLVKV